MNACDVRLCNIRTSLLVDIEINISQVAFGTGTKLNAIDFHSVTLC